MGRATTRAWARVRHRAGGRNPTPSDTIWSKFASDPGLGVGMTVVVGGDQFRISHPIFYGRVSQIAIFSHGRPYDWELLLGSPVETMVSAWCTLRLRYHSVEIEMVPFLIISTKGTESGCRVYSLMVS